MNHLYLKDCSTPLGEMKRWRSVEISSLIASARGLFPEVKGACKRMTENLKLLLLFVFAFVFGPIFISVFVFECVFACVFLLVFACVFAFVSHVASFYRNLVCVILLILEAKTCTEKWANPIERSQKKNTSFLSLLTYGRPPGSAEANRRFRHVFNDVG